MRFKDIQQLRDDGRIEEALDAARYMYNECVDHRSASELFWCLRAYFYSITSIEEKKEIAEEMIEVSLDIPGSNESVRNTLRKINREIMPNKSIMNEANLLVNEGKALDAYRMLLDYYEKGQLEKAQYESFGWVIYKALNQNKSMRLSERQMLYDNYYKLNLKTPSLLHSCILWDAINTKYKNPNNFSFIGFVESWGLKNFREEDWEGKRNSDGSRYLSLVEKMILNYMDEIKANSSLIPTRIFVEVLSKACRKWSKNADLQNHKAIAQSRIGR